MDDFTKNAYKAVGLTLVATIAIVTTAVYASSKVNEVILNHYFPDL